MKGCSTSSVEVREGSPTTPMDSVHAQLSSRLYSVQRISLSVQLYHCPAAAFAVPFSYISTVCGGGARVQGKGALERALRGAPKTRN